jgi:hypothetical protein
MREQEIFMQPLIYDIEIAFAVPPKNSEDMLSGIIYCQGWHDHANMGISVICTFDYATQRFRVFLEDNMNEFLALARERLMVGFNSIPFDDAVINAVYGDRYQPLASYDILRETWIAAGLGPDFEYPSHAGYSLDAIAHANHFSGKSGHGALAPVQWQRGEIGSVIDYCLQDVAITKRLFDKIDIERALVCPKTGRLLTLADPMADLVSA